MLVAALAACLAFVAVPVVPAVTAVPTGANANNLGIIKGIVRDEGGSPIADATVAIFRLGTSRVLKQVASGRDGSFLARIMPGTYSVLAVAEGFNPVTVSSLQVNAAGETVYGFKLERAGSGNTLPERRSDRNSSRWRIKAAQSQRSIYQNNEGDTGLDAEEEPETADARTGSRKGQAVIETFAAGSEAGSYAGVNFAAMVPVADDAEVVIAGQTGRGAHAPQRVEAGFQFRGAPDHNIRVNSGVAMYGRLPALNERLGQMSFQAIDEWRVRDGFILVLGFDYSRFFGAGDDGALSPRIGVQYDLDPRTRLRSAFTAQTEEKTWANAIELEGRSVGFVEPVGIDDIVVVQGKPQLNRSRRLEFGIERILDSSSSIDANIFLDTTPGRGVGLNSVGFDTLGSEGFGDIVANQHGRALGMRVVYAKRLNHFMSAAGGYAFGNGQRLSAGAISDPTQVFEGDFFQTFFAQVSAELSTGTHIRTVYRLSPDATVFAIDPFRGRLAVFDPGLSIYVTHPLPTLGLPVRAQAIVDARNLFDTQSGITGEEGSLRLAAHRRIVRGGIQVRF